MRAFKAIAALSENRVIGSEGRIPWYLPDDFRWFKQTTMGGILVMGRKTFESIGRPLPGRETIILSRQAFQHPLTRTLKSLQELLAAVAEEPRQVWICGGAEVYRQFLPICAEILLSRVHQTVAGDTLFPEISREFELSEELLRTPEFHVERHLRKANAPLTVAAT